MKYLLFFLFLCIGQFVFSQSYNLTIEIQNLKHKKGKIEIGVYDKKENFPIAKKQYRHFIIGADNFPGTYTINNLPKGEYAIAVFHDENADGLCNTNLLGIPIEGYGFSKNAKPVFSAPSFNECKILLNTNLTINIKLVY